MKKHCYTITYKNSVIAIDGFDENGVFFELVALNESQESKELIQKIHKLYFNRVAKNNFQYKHTFAPNNVLSKEFTSEVTWLATQFPEMSIEYTGPDFYETYDPNRT